MFKYSAESSQSTFRHSQHGAIAQLEEHLLCKQEVKGSTPFSSTIHEDVSCWKMSIKLLMCVAGSSPVVLTDFEFALLAQQVRAVDS